MLVLNILSMTLRKNIKELLMKQHTVRHLSNGNLHVRLKVCLLYIFLSTSKWSQFSDMLICSKLSKG